MECVSDESFKNQFNFISRFLAAAMCASSHCSCCTKTFVQIHDTNEIKPLNSILNKDCSNLLETNTALT